MDFLQKTYIFLHKLPYRGIPCCMKDLCTLSVEELTVLASTVSLELARGKSSEEILVLRNLLTQIAQTLFTIASQKTFLERNCKEPEPLTFDADKRTKPTC